MWFGGKRKLDAVWVSEEIEISAYGLLPSRFSIGDYRGISIDVLLQSLIEVYPLKYFRTKVLQL